MTFKIFRATIHPFQGLIVVNDGRGLTKCGPDELPARPHLGTPENAGPTTDVCTIWSHAGALRSNYKQFKVLIRCYDGSIGGNPNWTRDWTPRTGACVSALETPCIEFNAARHQPKPGISRSLPKLDPCAFMRLRLVGLSTMLEIYFYQTPDASSAISWPWWFARRARPTFWLLSVICHVTHFLFFFFFFFLD